MENRKKSDQVATGNGSAEGKEERVLILAPLGQDAELASKVLTKVGLCCMRCRGAEDLRSEIDAGAGALLLTEEALSSQVVGTLTEALEAQPSWSNLPMVLLTNGRQPSSKSRHFIERVGRGRKATILERPVGVLTLTTTVKSALQARRRQYEARDLVLHLEELNATLERRVEKRTAALKTANERLKQEIADRKQLERDNLEISTQERQWFAQELHDGLCQQLSSLSFMMAALKAKLDDDEELVEQAERITSLCSQSIRETRALAHGLFPIDLEDGGLVEALEVLASDTTEAYQVTCNVEVQEPPQIGDLLVATNLYRITQEAISNAVRHGQAEHIVITLKDGQALTLQVADDGIGMGEKPVPAGETGIGLKTMTRRARTIGGSLDVRPGEDGGTVVECRLSPRGDGLGNDTSLSVVSSKLESAPR